MNNSNLITADEFALLCYLAIVSPWGKKHPEDLTKMAYIANRGFSAFKELSPRQKDAMVEYFEEHGLVKPDILENHRVIHKE